MKTLNCPMMYYMKLINFISIKIDFQFIFIKDISAMSTGTPKIFLVKIIKIFIDNLLFS
jgi:hypothetical protein